MRKGQKLISIISLKLKNEGYAISNDNIERVIWNMSNSEFDEIMNYTKL